MDNQWLDLAYDDYHQWKGWKDAREAEGEVARAIAELKMAGVAAPARLLEVGFGGGSFLRRARALGYDCTGVERAGAAATGLAEHGIDLRYGALDQLAGKTFDVVVAFDVFEHIAIPNLITMLQEIAAMLTPDGRLLARFPNMASPFGLVNHYGDVTHITGLSPGSFAQLARMAGLETVTIANGATVLRGSRGMRRLIKPLSLLMRKTIEAVLSFAYYGKFTPLSPSVVVVMRKHG